MNEQRPMTSRAEDQLDHVPGHQHDHHAAGEQGEGGEEVGVSTVATHVVETEEICTSNEMNATSVSSRMARPSTLRADAEVARPEFCHQTQVGTTGSMNGSQRHGLPRRRGQRPPERVEQARRSSPELVRWIHWKRSCRRPMTRAAAIEASPTSAPFIGRCLPNAMMMANPMTGISPDQPGILEEPARA